MATIQTQSMPREQFLTVSANLLHKAFIDLTRTEAKNLFKAIAAGQAVKLTTVQMEDKSTVQFNLSLDHSEYRGKLNYGAFRASLVTLIGNISQALKEQKEVAVFNAQEDSGSMMFGISAPTLEEGEANVMVLAADIGGQDPAVMLRLMYLDPDQFTADEVS